ncbi:hypothetical protein NE237_005586 [Protea cynaroides]|uniref:Uncharacterized protein n=1 Tax=Protea cynaroides TaxID=273540 RepID=A0A9Q0GL74_9MAGN|nr:hypothetical protein NE237_005586 [Protea cynaroides]
MVTDIVRQTISVVRRNLRGLVSCSPARPNFELLCGSAARLLQLKKSPNIESRCMEVRSDSACSIPPLRNNGDFVFGGEPY